MATIIEIENKIKEKKPINYFTIAFKNSYEDSLFKEFSKVCLGNSGIKEFNRQLNIVKSFNPAIIRVEVYLLAKSKIQYNATYTYILDNEEKAKHLPQIISQN